MSRLDILVAWYVDQSGAGSHAVADHVTMVVCMNRRVASAEWMQAYVPQGATQREPAYHHEHSKAGSANLHKDVRQAFQHGYVAGDHCCDGDCWIEVASRYIGRDVDCRTSRILTST